MPGPMLGFEETRQLNPGLHRATSSSCRVSLSMPGRHKRRCVKEEKPAPWKQDGSLPQMGGYLHGKQLAVLTKIPHLLVGYPYPHID